MKVLLKKSIKSVLQLLHLDVTQNMKYDRLSEQIMERVLKSDSICIDIGCHKGELMDIMLKYAPNGPHSGFEPISWMASELEKKFNGKPVMIYPFALSSESGSAHFNIVKNAPAYSGLNRREYKTANPEIETVEVTVETLDRMFETSNRIDLIKLDVEGAELNVLKGAESLIRRVRPAILFEFGLGSAEFYGAEPEELFQFLSKLNMDIYLLKGFIKKMPPLTKEAFVEHFKNRNEYYFFALPREKAFS